MKQDFHRDTLVVDTHNDVLSYLLDPAKEFYEKNGSTMIPKINLNQDLKELTKYGHVDINKLKEGGVDAAFFAVCVPERYFPGDTLNKVLMLINALYKNIKDNHLYLKLVTKRLSELESITPKDKRVGVFPSIEGLDMVDRACATELLKQLDDLNVRMMSLTWNDSNQIAEGLNSTFPDGRPSPPGLTLLGKKVVKEMNRLGIAVDISHLHERSFWDVLEVTNSPVIASHSGVAGIYDHRRNMTDEQLKALEENGGLIQINFARNFLCEDKTGASIKKIVDHVEYAKNFIGAKHVGLGSDFDGAEMPGDLKDASYYPAITGEMVKRGFSSEEIACILGKNTIRVMKEITKKAAGIFEDDKVPDYVPRFELLPHFESGTIFEEKDPLIGLTIREYSEQIKEESIKVIMDGYLYDAGGVDSWIHPHLKKTSKAIYFTPASKRIRGGFHVVTFIGESDLGQQVRETLIYYIEC